MQPEQSSEAASLSAMLTSTGECLLAAQVGRWNRYELEATGPMRPVSLDTIDAIRHAFSPWQLSRAEAALLAVIWT
ncbi:MAG: hypothetical protein FGM24_11515, partial [Candidatus Kapabacteria bacterium]|nr:hypothetical protein [Candidatus Kapabacteria bacterium]